jgi:hypothetical protein
MIPLIFTIFYYTTVMNQNSYLCREHIIDSYNIQELLSINN